MENNQLLEQIVARAMQLGVFKANVVSTDEIPLDRAFRDMCASNACGVYGKCHMCPPDVGDIDVLMGEIKGYKHALVYQTVTALEDSFDFEGMVDAKKQTYKLAQEFRKIFAELDVKDVLHLGAGGCGVCETCASARTSPAASPILRCPRLRRTASTYRGLRRQQG